MVTRDQITNTLNALNEAENSVVTNGVDAAIAGIDRTMSSFVVGWSNGEYRPDREAEHEAERMLFTVLPDYHRIFERVIIDPPFAAVAWKITGTNQQQSCGFELQGASQFEFADDGKVAKYWLYGDMSQFSALGDASI